MIYDPDLLPPTRYAGDHGGIPDFQHTPDQRERWLKHLSVADILFDFPSLTEGGPGILELSPNLRWVQTTSAGVGQYIVRLGLQDSNLLVTTASGVHAGPLAEYVFMTLLNHAKYLAHIRQEQAQRHWERYCSDELAGKTLGIVGAGRIGRRIASIARAFDMRPIAVARTASPGRELVLGVDTLFSGSELHEMLAQADAVVLCMPHTPETDGIIDRAAFDAMKDGVVFINIARGQVVDEEALLDAITSGKIAFAALDVFQTEPLPADHPFWGFPNVMVSPHSASTSYSENAKITDIFCHNLTCFVEGRYDEMRNVLDKERMY